MHIFNQNLCVDKFYKNMYAYHSFSERDMYVRISFAYFFKYLIRLCYDHLRK